MSISGKFDERAQEHTMFKSKIRVQTVPPMIFLESGVFFARSFLRSLEKLYLMACHVILL